MRAPLSIIIPTLNAEATLPKCLSALIEGLEAGLIREVIVSDGGSSDATCDIAEAAGATVTIGPPSRGAQLHRGAEAAAGAHLLLLHADTRLEPGWARVVEAHLHTGHAGYFRLAFDTADVPARVVAGWANLRSRLFGLPFGDQGLVLPRHLLSEVGGVPDIPLMEDVALARALRGRLRMLDACAVTSADRYRRDGWIVRGWRNLMLQARFFAGADPAELYRRYGS